MMRRIVECGACAVAVVGLAGLSALDAHGEVFVQCPGDVNGNAVRDVDETLWGDRNGNGVIDPGENPDRQKCMHLSAGDGFVNMSDFEATPTMVVPLGSDGSYQGATQLRGRLQYMFGFSDVTGMPPGDVLVEGVLGAEFPAPTIELDEGDELYLTLTNVGMAIRPDLFDAHTVHWHGYPDAAAVFDGLPDASISIMMGSSLTYYYTVKEPGTYMYHCHVEATEHMQMGMLGNLYVRAAQSRLWDELVDSSGIYVAPNGYVHHEGDEYAYNDGDGSTHYDVDYPIQLSSFDPDFHDASLAVAPLPFAEMNDTYPMINGRGYPETTFEGSLHNEENGLPTSPMSSLVKARAGDRILLRVSNLSITQFFTLVSPSIKMRVIGAGAKHLRGPSGDDLSYETSSVTLGGGGAFDVLLDTSGMSPGTYFLYTSNMQFLSNNTEERGGVMTEIHLQ